MVKRVKDFWKAHAADVADTFLVAVGSTVVIGLITFGRVAAFLA